MSAAVRQRVEEVFFAELDGFVEESAKRVEAAGITFYTSMPREAAKAAYRRAFEATGRDLGAAEPTAFPGLMTMIGTLRVGAGVLIIDVLRGMLCGFEAVTDHFAVRFADDPEARIFWEQARGRISFMGAGALADAYLGVREKVVLAQAEEIAELSLRVLPLYPGILVLPLVGRLDAARAGAVTRTLLVAIAANASRVVLIDVTGVPVVDAGSAGHLLAAARGAELLGATPILVGVSAGVARAMVDAGVALGGLTTLSNLAAGLSHALQIVGKAIVSRAP